MRLYDHYAGIEKHRIVTRISWIIFSKHSLIWLFSEYSKSSVFFCMSWFFFFLVGFELRALNLQSGSTAWTTPPVQALPLELCLHPFFTSGYFSHRVLHFLPGVSLRQQSSYLCLLSCWDHRCIPPCPYYLLRCGLANFLPGIAILLNSTSWVAGVTGLSPHTQPMTRSF
jgi:hypothetical protein